MWKSSLRIPVISLVLPKFDIKPKVFDFLPLSRGKSPHRLVIWDCGAVVDSSQISHCSIVLIIEKIRSNLVVSDRKQKKLKNNQGSKYLPSQYPSVPPIITSGDQRLSS
jgi:hypothetical protein